MNSLNELVLFVLAIVTAPVPISQAHAIKNTAPLTQHEKIMKACKPYKGLARIHATISKKETTFKIRCKDGSVVTLDGKVVS